MKRKTETTSAVDLLEKIKAYTEFESVTISPDGTVSVKFANDRQAAAEKYAKKKKEETPVRKTAIDSLSEVAPPFKFGN